MFQFVLIIMPVKATKGMTTKLSLIWHYLSVGAGYYQYLEIPKTFRYAATRHKVYHTNN